MRPRAAGTSGGSRPLTGWLLASLVLALPEVQAAQSDLRRLEAGLPSSGQWRNGFDLIDLDGDGRLDLVHGPSRKGKRVPQLFRGLGGGRFERWEQARFPDLPFDYGDAAGADFDGDGVTDLAFAVHLGGITALRGDGRGGFSPHTGGLDLLPPGEGAFSSRAIEIVDWNSDGKPDLAVLGEGPSSGRPPGPRGLAVFLNRGSDGWRRLEGPDDKGFGDSLAILDADLDGRSDAVVAVRRQGDRKLLRRQTSDGLWVLEEIDAARADSYFPAVAVVDRGDESSAPAIALSFVERLGERWRSGVDILRRTAEGWRRTEVMIDPSGREIRALAIGDLDGDGATDLAMGNRLGEVRVYLGRTGGSRNGDRFKRLSSKQLERAGGGCSAYGARMADLDGDGRDELVVSFAGEPKGDQCASRGSLQVWGVAGS